MCLSVYVFIGRTLRPLDGLADAMEEVGAGRYGTRMRGRLAPELSRLRDSFNRMAARLADADAENRRLNEQLLTLQEQERSDLARDLHDEVSPFLFAINVDAATASRLMREGRATEARGHVQSITDAVRHMQRQVRRACSVACDRSGSRNSVCVRQSKIRSGSGGAGVPRFATR